jgi:hypothetical protein
MALNFIRLLWNTYISIPNKKSPPFGGLYFLAKAGIIV